MRGWCAVRLRGGCLEAAGRWPFHGLAGSRRRARAEVVTWVLGECRWERIRVVVEELLCANGWWQVLLRRAGCVMTADDRQMTTGSASGLRAKFGVRQ